jgi:hypothetical protein
MASYTTGQAPINMQQVSAVPSAYQADALELARAQRLAQMLSSTQPAEGQMISGRYVAPSWTQSLAQLANAATGAYFSNKAETQQQALAEKLRKGEIEALADFEKIKRGTPAVEGGIYGPDNKLTMQTTPDMFGANMELNPQYRRVAPVAGVAPNPTAAYANLYADPRASQRQRDLAWQKMTADAEEITLPEGATRVQKQPDGSYKIVAAGGEKIRTPLQVDTGTHIEFRDPLDPSKVLARVARTKDTSGKDFSNALALRKEFNGEGIYKGYQEVKNAWNQINTGLNAKTPAGDLAAATKFMKLLDPTSVVRESELLMAMQASGALDRLYNYAQMRVNGTKLTPTQREDFRKLSDEFYQTSLNQYNEKFNEYKDIALRNNLNPDDIGKPDVFKSQVAPKEEKPKPTVKQQLSVPTVKAPKFLGFE